MSVYLLSGKVLLNAGHVAASDACCCGGGGGGVCCGFYDCDDVNYYRTKTIHWEWSAAGPAVCGDCTTTGSITKVIRYNDACELEVISCSGTATADCGDLHVSCTYDLVSGNCVLEPDSDCPADPFTLFQLCAGTSTIEHTCDGVVYTETRTSNAGYGVLTYTETLSELAGCRKTVSISISVDVTDTETEGCDFHAHHEEVLVDAETVDLCAHAWGPFEFTYPGYDNGQIYVGDIIIGLGGPDPPPIVVAVGEFCSAFYLYPCGSGYVCFATGDGYYDGDPDLSFPVCSPPATLNLHWTLNDGMGFSIVHTMTITFS